MKIPRLVGTEQIESLFRKIMVFKQCHYFSDSYMIDCIAFLDGLINTPRMWKCSFKMGWLRTG